MTPPFGQFVTYISFTRKKFVKSTETVQNIIFFISQLILVYFLAMQDFCEAFEAFLLSGKDIFTTDKPEAPIVFVDPLVEHFEELEVVDDPEMMER